MDVSQHASDQCWRTDPHMRAVPGVDSTGPIDHMHRMAQNILGETDDIDCPQQTEPPAYADSATATHSEGLELNQLLTQQGIFDFPLLDVCEEFFCAFMRHVYPNLPCLDIAQVHTLHQRSVDLIQSPLVLWATLLASCPYVERNILRGIGYRSHREAQESMLKKAKFVYKTGIEKDPLAQIQCVLLISMWQGGPENSCVWLGLAVGLAEQHGLNKAPVPLSPAAASRRRVWACIYVRDMQLAILHHHPYQMHDGAEPLAAADDFLQGLLTPQQADPVPSPLQSELAELFVHRVGFYIEARRLVRRLYCSAWTVTSAGDPCSILAPRPGTSLHGDSPAGPPLDKWSIPGEGRQSLAVAWL